MTVQRLATIMEFNQIIVLEEGRIVEMGHPYELIQTSRGYFRSLVDKNGYACAMNLIKIAEKSFFIREGKEGKNHVCRI